MRIRLLVVGDRQPSWVDTAVNEYLKRIRLPWRVELQLLPTASRAHRTAEQAMQRESEQVLASLRTKEKLVLLDERGRRFTSLEFAHHLQRLATDSPDLVMVIGGPDGHAPALESRAAERWSLSDMTLPHGLARVVMAEQLYRAQSVLAGHPYHRES
jgi:23S rRNA (pseudouridine1915-N3)-methyltransferase